LARHQCTEAPVAYLLEVSGRNVGIILTIPSERMHENGTQDRVVNLSSWYVDGEHRWRAPRMLQQITANDNTLYTDLTPTSPVQTLIGRLDFKRWTEGALLFPLPWFAWRRTGDAHVVPLDRLPADAVPASILRIMTQHAAWDCLSAALWDGTRLHPLIFSRTQRKGLPIARLLYAGDRAVVTRWMPAIARYLMRERMVLLAMSANRSERMPGSIFTRRVPPTFYKGATNTSAIDHTYSEFVFLQF
jgi:hypothetical protein